MGCGERTLLRRFLFGFLIGVVTVPLAGYAYFAFGFAPVATAAPDMPFEKMLAKKALHARLEKEMPKDVPLPWDEANFTAGAQIYIQHCAVCHGLPGQPQTAIARGMYPKPPELFKGKGVTDDPPGATYWRVANGIRLTGMPGFQQSLSQTQMWQVSVLLANAGSLPQNVKNTLAAARIP
ncbi:MAG: c-type cytochrome [Acidobacteriia bacterium]|nr:c-type cytochrome [Terriglobia bacterium]